VGAGLGGGEAGSALPDGFGEGAGEALGGGGPDGLGEGGGGGGTPRAAAMSF